MTVPACIVVEQTLLCVTCFISSKASFCNENKNKKILFENTLCIALPLQPRGIISKIWSVIFSYLNYIALALLFTGQCHQTTWPSHKY